MAGAVTYHYLLKNAIKLEMLAMHNYLYNSNLGLPPVISRASILSVSTGLPGQYEPADRLDNSLSRNYAATRYCYHYIVLDRQ